MNATLKEAADVPESVARTYRGYHEFTDLMLRAAAAEAGRALGADTIRWMGYVDQELCRLRSILDLDCQPGYASGRPQYGAER